MCIKDIENAAVNLDGTPDVEGGDGGGDAARAKSRFDEAVQRNKDIGKRDPGRDR